MAFSIVKTFGVSIAAVSQVLGPSAPWVSDECNEDSDYILFPSVKSFTVLCPSMTNKHINFFDLVTCLKQDLWGSRYQTFWHSPLLGSHLWSFQLSRKVIYLEKTRMQSRWCWISFMDFKALCNLALCKLHALSLSCISYLGIPILDGGSFFSTFWSLKGMLTWETPDQ